MTVIASNDEILEEGMSVLVRNNENEYWKYGIFSDYDTEKEYPYICIIGSYKHCIPYYTNKELFNTTKSKRSKDVYIPKFGDKVKVTFNKNQIDEYIEEGYIIDHNVKSINLYSMVIQKPSSNGNYTYDIIGISEDDIIEKIKRE